MDLLSDCKSLFKQGLAYRNKTVAIEPKSDRKWVYNHRLSQFKVLPGVAPIVMVGDSLTENGEWGELLPKYQTLNRGISGDTVKGLARRLEEIVSRKPKIVLGLVGVNDIARGMCAQELVSHIQSIAARLQAEDIAVVWQSVLYTAPPRTISNEMIAETNALLNDGLSATGVNYLDLNSVLSRQKMLCPEVSEDGLHLNGEGYRRWADLIELWLNQHRPDLKDHYKQIC